MATFNVTGTSNVLQQGDPISFSEQTCFGAPAITRKGGRQLRLHQGGLTSLYICEALSFTGEPLLLSLSLKSGDYRQQIPADASDLTKKRTASYPGRIAIL